ncbi:MAG: hypothetical protein ACYTHM_19450 [Planctomycetota bacterium]|jgi:hypothetical protein
MGKYILIGMAVLGICGMILAETSFAWGGGGWGPGKGGRGGGGRPTGGKGTGGKTPGGKDPGRPTDPGETGKGLLDQALNKEFDFEYMGEKETDYHREALASVFQKRE